MSRSRWLVLVSYLALATIVPARPAHAEQPAVTPPASPAQPPAPAASAPLPAPTTPPAAQPQPSAPVAPAPLPAPIAPAAPSPVPAVPAPPTPVAPPPAPPQSGPPMASQTPRYPPPPAYPAAAPAAPRGTAAPGATPMMLPAPAPRPRVERYPLAVMVADAAWMLAGWRMESPGLLLGGYVGAAPLAHALMGNTRGALISGGLRASALVFTVGATAHAFASDCGDCEAEGGLIAAGLIGGATIMVVDWLVLARKEIPVRVPAQPHSAPAWGVTPQVQAEQGGLQLGVGGWF